MPRPATGLNTASRRLPDGTIEYRWYHRTTGLLIGTSAAGWTKQQAIEHARGLEAETPSGPAAGSFGELATLYLASPRFRKLAPKTQKEYRYHIDVMREMWAAVPLIGITRTSARTLHAAYQDRPWMGNAMLRTLRLLFNHGIDDLELPGLVKNPVAKLTPYETAPRRQFWDELRIEAFLGMAEPRLRLAFALLLYTVQRPADMLTMGRPMMFERDGRHWIRLRQAKTDELVDVPCHHRLVAIMQEAMRAQALAEAQQSRDGRPSIVVQSTLLVPSPRGLPWTYRNFARAWDRTCTLTNWRIARTAILAMGGLPPRHQPAQRAAALAGLRARMITGLQRRDLRRTGVINMALAGSTVPQIAALAGWKIDYAQNIVDTYLPRRGEIALGAVERWENQQDKVISLPRAPRRG